MLNAKYFTNGDIFHPKCIDKPSYTWQSIASVARMFKNGFDWMVADRKSIDIRRDNWDFEGLTGESICLSRLTIQEQKACDIWNTNNVGLNENRANEIFGKNMGEQICKVLIITNGPND